MKANIEAQSREVKFSDLAVLIEPTLEDIEAFVALARSQSDVISVDIETSHQQITCIGFHTRGSLVAEYLAREAPHCTGDSMAIVIPLVDFRKPGYSYWPDVESEAKVLNCIRELLDLPPVKLLQNGLYDVQYIWKTISTPVRNFSQDTMLMHHSQQPEMTKGLGFLGSIYTNFPSWKHMRPRGKSQVKLDE
jgi:hypothetical protein